MPAPTFSEIKNAVTAACIAEGLGQKEFDSDQNLQETTPPKLAPETEKLVNGISKGIADFWKEWQAKQNVVVGPHAAGGAASGVPPAALP